MPELTPRSPLAAIVVAGHHTRRGAPGVTLSERTGIGLATIAARRGQSPRLLMAVRDAYGVDLPAGPKVVADATSPSWAPLRPVRGSRRSPTARWRMTSPRGSPARLVTTRATGGRSCVSGPRARDVLAKGLPIDLHPKAFGPGDAATTVASLIGVQLWQVDEAPAYDLAVFRGYAGSFWHWLTSSAAEYGYVVESAGAAPVDPTAQD